MMGGVENVGVEGTHAHTHIHIQMKNSFHQTVFSNAHESEWIFPTYTNMYIRMYTDITHVQVRTYNVIH